MKENERFLCEQLITYIGNKRALLPFIGKGIDIVRTRLGKPKVRAFDVFSGSGVVSRFFKQYSSYLVTNDLENYASIINRCYLSNIEEVDVTLLRHIHAELLHQLDLTPLKSGLIAELYAPRDDTNILAGERVFYTTKNAQFLDAARKAITSIDINLQPYFIAPLLSEASVHANTSGVFKGFYKNKDTGIGTFGGTKGDALTRIRGNISLPFPVFSNFSCETQILTGDANQICKTVQNMDIAYIDPPYNQHPYGSNYFMLNVLLEYKKPASMSEVSGIPTDWKRSAYNSRRHAVNELSRLIENIDAKFLLISFNSEGFIPLENMTSLLSAYGTLDILETKYNTFRGSRNLGERNLHVKEYLYLLEKK